MKRRIVLVTGASSGIGAAAVSELAKAGHRVYGTSRDPNHRGSPDCAWLTLDVCEEASVRAGIARVVEAEGGIDVLVNNAGYLVAGAIEEVSLEQGRAQLETNFFGVVRMVQAVLPTMRRQRSGLIVNISSLAGLVPVPFWGFYNASKFAVEGFSETLRYEVAPFGIKVAMVEPGAIKTAFYMRPQTVGMAEYSPWRERAMAKMSEFEQKAPGPEIVARKVAALVSQTNPPLRNRITSEASLFTFLRWFLPARAYEQGIRRGFQLNIKGV
jgi:NAD(P)-dependent dehydrogenase (short-subunit alcohol dehydrogenase family)